MNPIQNPRTSCDVVFESLPVPTTHNIHPMLTRSKVGIRKPKTIFILQAQCLVEVEPITYKEAA